MRYRQPTVYAVGAASPRSIDFVAPLFVRAVTGNESFSKVFIAFPRQQSFSRSWAYSFESHLGLPLPGFLRAQASNRLSAPRERASDLPRQLFVHLYGTGKEALAVGFLRWVRRFGAMVYAAGDKELGRLIITRGRQLWGMFSSTLGQDDTWPGALKKLLEAIYRVALRAGYAVSVLPRELEVCLVEGEPQQLIVPPQHLRVVGEGFPRGVTFKRNLAERGSLSLLHGGATYRLTALDHSECDIMMTFEARDTILKTRLRESADPGGLQPAARGLLSPYGLLTLLHVAAEGIPGHVPWYAPIRRGGQAAVQATEFISPYWPKSTSRASPVVGGTCRLFPSGATLLDYDAPEITRFVNAAFGEPMAQHRAWWLLLRILEAAHYGRLRASRIIRKARRVASALTCEFAQALEQGRGFDVLSRCGTIQNLNDRSVCFFSAVALLKVWRKQTHPQSCVRPKRRFARELQRQGVTREDLPVFVIAVIYQCLTQCARERHFIWGHSEARLKDAIDAAAACHDSVTSSASTFRVSSADEAWQRVGILERRLQELAACGIEQLWVLGRIALEANLVTVALLVDLQSINSIVEKMVNRRQIRKAIALRVPVIRKGAL